MGLHSFVEIPSRRTSWLVGGMLALVEVGVLYAIGPKIFYVGDDTLIQHILSGSASGGDPNPYTVFVGYALSSALAALFRVLPGVPWWTAFSIGAILLSIASINRCLIRSLYKILVHRGIAKRSHATILGIVACIVVGMGVCSVAVLEIQFSYTAALCGMASIVCVGCLLVDDFFDGESSSRLIRCGAVALITLLVGLVFSIRRDVGLVAAVFCVTVWVACSVRRSNSDGASRGVLQRMRMGLEVRALSVLLVSAAFAGLLGLINSVAYSAPEWQEFMTANSERSNYVDYQRGTYEEYSEDYHEIGWDETLYRLVRRLYFIDADVNTESLHDINEATKESVGRQNPITAFFTRSGVFADAHVFVLCLALVVTFALCLVVAPGKRMRVAATVTLVLSGLMVCYLGLRGRLISRSIVPVLLMGLACLWACALAEFLSIGGRAKTDAGCARKRRAWLAGIIGLAYFAAVALPLYYCMEYVGASSDAENRARGNQTVSLVDIYIEGHPSDVFVFGGSKYLDSALGNAYDPPNKLYWGGWRYFAPWHELAMEQAGFPDGFSEEDFLLENVFFVSLDDDSAELLSSHLSDSLGREVNAAPVEEIGDATIYALR